MRSVMVHLRLNRCPHFPPFLPPPKQPEHGKKSGVFAACKGLEDLREGIVDVKGRVVIDLGVD